MMVGGIFMQNTGFEIKEAVSMGSVTAEGVAKALRSVMR